MNYYPFHVGDYAAHTAHLEPMEDLAYRRMLDAYYLREEPLPAEPADVARLIRMRQNMAEVEAVLREFFTLSSDGWRHSRCDEEIERMQDKQAKARASATASVNARRAKAHPTLNDGSTSAQRPLSERSADAELPTPTPTPTPIINNNTSAVPTSNQSEDETCELEKTKRLRHAALKIKDLVTLGVSEQVARDFLAARKTKFTETALAGFQREAAKARITIEQALATATERGWQGFKADWVDKKTKRHTGFDDIDYSAGVPEDGRF